MFSLQNLTNVVKANKGLTVSIRYFKIKNYLNNY